MCKKLPFFGCISNKFQKPTILLLNIKCSGKIACYKNIFFNMTSGGFKLALSPALTFCYHLRWFAFKSTFTGITGRKGCFYLV